VPAPHVDAITATALTAPRSPPIARAPTDRPGRARVYTVFDVDRDRRDRLARWLIAVGGSADGWPAPAMDAIGELAAIASLDRASSAREQTVRGSIADAAIQALVTESAPLAEVYLRQLGIDVDASAVVLSAGLDLGSSRDDDVRALVEDALGSVATPVVGVGNPGELLAVVQAAEHDAHARLAAHLRRSLGRVGPGLRRDRLTVGVSGVTTVPALGGAVRAARSARLLCGDGRLVVQVVSEADIRSTRALLNSVPDAARTAFAERVLGPVLTYDSRATGDLIPTLQAFFACDGSWSRTAEQLGLHINTVRYRIARIEQLTGRAVARTDDWVDLYAALTLLRPVG
jgi:sugar diacid utilization regulator